MIVEGVLRPIVCELQTQSEPAHLQQLFTGFAMLARAGVVAVSERFVHGPPSLDCTLTARIADRMIVYDVHDSETVDPTLLDGADFYFKRSFRPGYVDSLGVAGQRVHPLGLNYEVYPDHVDPAAARRHWCLRRGIRRITGVLSAQNFTPRFVPRLSSLESMRPEGGNGQVVFLTRAWDPNDSTERSPEAAAQRASITEMRARCIDRLRRHFGHRALTGFAPSAYARRRYPELLVADPSVIDKRRYLEIVRRSDVCVTSAGVHGSIGWKFGEYVALGKSIVSERIDHVVPGSFADGRNYLCFTSADECVERAETLLANPDLRRAMQASNIDYYESHLRPDRLVLNTLVHALAGGDCATIRRLDRLSVRCAAARERFRLTQAR